MYVQEKAVYIGFSIIWGFSYPLGVLECIPVEKGGWPESIN